MNNAKTLTTKQYQQLISDIKTLINLGREEAATLIKNHLAITYWKIGERVVQASLTENANYQSSILEDIARELKLEKSLLSRCVFFYNTYPQMPQSPGLTWSHYRELLGVKDHKNRLKFEYEATQNNWSKERLVFAIKQEKQRFMASKESTNNQLTRPSEGTFLYKAKVKDVVDGDTLVLIIDLGFAVHKEQRIRLAGIDCEKIDAKTKTGPGREAFEYVRDLMAKVNFVMVKTHKIDIYGRYLGHVFYDLEESISTQKSRAKEHKIFEEGKYLNQDLLDLGLAQMV